MGVFRGDRSKYESIPLDTNNLVRKQLDVKKVIIFDMIITMIIGQKYCETASISIIQSSNKMDEQSTCQMMNR